MALAASSHLAYKAVCFVSLVFHLAVRPCCGAQKKFSPGPELALGLSCFHGREQRDKTQSRPMGTLCRKCQDIELQFYAPEYVTKGKQKREKYKNKTQIPSGLHLSPPNGSFFFLHSLCTVNVGPERFLLPCHFL